MSTSSKSSSIKMRNESTWNILTTSTINEWMNCKPGYYSNSIQKWVTRFEDNCDSFSSHTRCIKKGWVNCAHRRSSTTVIFQAVRSKNLQMKSHHLKENVKVKVNVQTSKEVYVWFETIRWKLVKPIKSKTILVRVWFIWTLSDDTAPQNPSTWGMIRQQSDIASHKPTRLHLQNQTPWDSNALSER